ncbi:DUF1990 family protein [Streptomyces sp. Amel2xB2]|uniref:DUF1990 family protein n=1 Tax=Streptomyces sp. Amel2xB2 TaxID=1305829 RepID=UPI000DB978E7|nr:DUF1990 family protein [Streptomyces sp. Amel2xB2]
MSTPRAAPPQGPSPLRRAGVLARFPLGVLVVSWQYLWRVTALHRAETSGDESDLPPALPDGLCDERSKMLTDGSGPMFHRRFRVRVEDSPLTAAGMTDAVMANLNRVAPSSVAVFHKTRGPGGPPRVGDEYRVQMPGPWDGPVRVVHRDPLSLRLGTLQGHLEAGQIEFRSRALADGGLEFGIEAWSRAGDRMADLLYSRLRVAKEMQFNMWVHFCLRAAAVAGGRVAGGVHIDTRSIPEALCRAEPAASRTGG